MIESGFEESSIGEGQSESFDTPRHQNNEKIASTNAKRTISTGSTHTGNHTVESSIRCGLKDAHVVARASGVDVSEYYSRDFRPHLKF